MATYRSGTVDIQIDQLEAEGAEKRPALLVLHGSGGAASYWMERFSPALRQAGVGIYAPHYFDKTATVRATTALILDGRHFLAWLVAVQDALTYVTARPNVDAERIAVLGISLGGYLAVALGIEDERIRAVVELSAGIPPGWEDRVTAAMPPVLILHGADDNVVPVSEARKLETLLNERGVSHETEIIPGQTHWFAGTAQLDLLRRCAGFLRRHVLDEGSFRKAG